MLDLAVAIPTLLGSVLSMFAAGFIFMCYLILPPQKHFRHTLILNLAAADFFNATNNTISGIYALRHRSIPAGFACTVNGWVGQVTVQGTDFAILFISIATVMILRKWNYEPQMTTSKKILLSFGIWLVPLSTSITGLILDDYKPVSGNWCWFDAERPALRYILGHAWRIGIIITTICLYSYLFIYMHRHFASQRLIAELNEKSEAIRIQHWSDTTSMAGEGAESRNNIYVHAEFEIAEEEHRRYFDGSDERPWYEDKDYFINFPTHPKDVAKSNASASETKTRELPHSPCSSIRHTIHPNYSETTMDIESSQYLSETSSLMTRDPLALVRRPIPELSTTVTANSERATATVKSREIHVQKLLILNAYPIGYVLLWIPGVANRFAELSGHKSRALAILQASTQFVGLANALVYGYNERIWTMAGLWWKHKFTKTKVMVGIVEQADNRTSKAKSRLFR